MKKYLVKSKPDSKTANPFASKRQVFEAENPSDAICKANTANGGKWHVIAVYEQIWHI